MSPTQLLDAWLAPRLAASAAAWLASCCADIRAALGSESRVHELLPPRALAIAFSAAARRCGRADLALHPHELAATAARIPGLDPRGWSVDQVVRLRLISALCERPQVRESAGPDVETPAHIGTTAPIDVGTTSPPDETARGRRFAAQLERLCAAADVDELVAVQQGLCLLPYPAHLVARCAEGVRSNLRPVFLATAHGNPYPARYLDEDAWNQLVLKCLFVDAGLGPVHGLNARANPRLSRMLFDNARERRAAQRPIHPDLWDIASAGADSDLRRALTALRG